jgi:4-amino-4-deoxy-L-arabinose transferase-like glycosyltransferase
MAPGSAADRRAALLPALAILAILLVGAALRVSGIRFGDPFVYHPDEWAIARPAITMAATGDWNPHNFLYPSLLIEFEALFAGLLHAVGGATLATGQPWLYQNELVPDQFGYVLAGRLLVALLGTATILVVFETARRLAGGAAALAAAAIAAIVPLAVEHAHYLTTDVPMTFLCALSLLATVVASRSERRQWWLVAALIAGLAGSTKWNGLAVAAVPLLAYVTTRFDRAHPLAIIRDPIPYAMVGATIIAFVVPTPALMLAPAEVVSWVSSSAAIYAVPDPRQTQDTITFNLGALVGTLGPLLAWGSLGMIVVVARVRGDPSGRAAVVIPAFIVGYAILASLPPRYYARNLLPIIPYLAVSAGIALAALVDQVRRRSAVWRLPPGLAAAVVGLALILSLAPSTASSLALTGALSRTDTRDVARAWMLEHVPPGTTVAREVYTPQFDIAEFTLAGSFFLHEVSLDGYRTRGARYLIASSWAYERFVGKPATPVEDGFYRELFTLPEAFRVDPAPNRAGPTIRIISLDARGD